MSTHRYVCSVLTEMRTCHRLYKMDMIPGLIEEVQTLVNRMEAKLADYREMGYDLKEAKKLSKTVASYKEQLEVIEEKLGIIKEDDDYDDDER